MAPPGSKKWGRKMTLQLDDVAYGKSPSRPVEGEGVDDGLFRIVLLLLNLLLINQETSSLMSEELYCHKKNHSKNKNNKIVSS